MDTTGERSAVLGQVGRLFVAGTVVGLTDGQLLDLFIAGRSERAEAAFEALMIRHGPMVLRVCRGVLDDPHDAEDAFQATFLVLARRAGTVRKRESIASWLHGVARRVATRAKVEASRRRSRERRAAECFPTSYEARPDFGAVHEEIDRLSASLREPVLLCYIEGMSYDTAAARLGLTEGTVRGRLARARGRLRSSLTRRGLGSFPACLSPAIDLLPSSLVTGVVQAVSGIATASSTVVGLAERTLRTMRSTQIGKALAAIGLVALGTTAFAMRPAADPAPAPKPASEVKQPPRSRTLSDGTIVEFVAISDNPTTPKTWWSPDGDRLAKPPYDQPQTIAMARATDQPTYGFVVRVRETSNLGVGWLDVRWEMDGEAQGAGVATCVRKDGDVVDCGLRVFPVGFPSTMSRATIRIGVSAGPWTTIAKCGPEVGAVGRGGKVSRRLGKPFSIAFTGAHATPRGTVICLVYNSDWQAETRLVAVDRDGREHDPVGASGGGFEGASLRDSEFDLPPDRIKEFRFQTRDLEWITFDDLALSPKKE